MNKIIELIRSLIEKRNVKKFDKINQGSWIDYDTLGDYPGQEFDY